MKRSAQTRIVATVGPASSSSDTIGKLIEAGVSIFRLNFSHGAHRDHEAVFHAIRRLSDQSGRVIGILQDLQGPKLRIGELDDPGSFTIQPGAEFRICTEPIAGAGDLVSTSYDRLAHDLEPGMPVLIDDGRIRLEVTSLEFDTENGDVVTTRVIHGGVLNPRKGINLPETQVSAPALTDKDREDLEFGVRLGVDFVALSFVRAAKDLHEARALIANLGGRQPLIAKIEKPQAVEVLPSIVDAADGVMVARGDLGVELSPEAVPLIQKRIIRLANKAGKPVITATQMLESMISAPQPTRAEASDVANAILDGTDAVMLSGETAVGDYPVETVEMMATIARTIERDPQSRGSLFRALRGIEDPHANQTEAQAIGHAARAIADDLRAEAVIVLTATGRTAQRISQERPSAPIIAFTDQIEVGRRLTLWHGVVPLVMPLEATIDRLIIQVDREIRERQLAQPGDRVVIVGANPRSTDAPSVFLEIHIVSA